MNSNPGISTVASGAWDGAASRPASIRDFNHFGFSFEVLTTIAADAKFKVQAAPASTNDPCVPGAFTDVEAIATCMGEAVPAGTLSEITIPAGTVAGSLCSAAIPCRPNVFVQLVPVSGDTANVRAFHLRQGPHN